MSSTKTLVLKTYQDLTLARSSSADKNVWHENMELSVKQGEQNANWQSSNSVEQCMHTKETFLWSVIHPLLKLSFVWYNLQEKKTSYRAQKNLKLPSVFIFSHNTIDFILPVFSGRTRQLFYSAVALRSLSVPYLSSVKYRSFQRNRASNSKWTYIHESRGQIAKEQPTTAKSKNLGFESEITEV